MSVLWWCYAVKGSETINGPEAEQTFSSFYLNHNSFSPLVKPYSQMRFYFDEKGTRSWTQTRPQSHCDSRMAGPHWQACTVHRLTLVQI